MAIDSGNDKLSFNICYKYVTSSFQQTALNEFIEAVEKQLSSSVNPQHQVKLADNSAMKMKISMQNECMGKGSEPTSKLCIANAIPRLEQWILKQPEAIKRLLKLGMEPSSVFTIKVSGFDDIYSESCI